MKRQALHYPPQCLLLGNTNLKHVRRSDLGDSSSEWTVTNKSNMDLLSSWVSEKWTWSPIHCDILWFIWYEYIYQWIEILSFIYILGYLFSNFRVKNSNVEINACQIAPVLSSQEVEARITNLKKVWWNKEKNDVCCENSSCVVFGTREIDNLYFEEGNQDLIINKLRLIKLLSTSQRDVMVFTVSMVLL